MTKTSMIKETCITCGGTGVLEQYKHYAYGRCFPCDGRGFRWVSSAAIAKREARAQKAFEDSAPVRARRAALEAEAAELFPDDRAAHYTFVNAYSDDVRDQMRTQEMERRAAVAAAEAETADIYNWTPN